MASTIEDLYETSSRSMLKERRSQLQNPTGLGPDDLVVLTKQEKNLVLSAGLQKNFYHCICGLQMDTPAAFPAYFADLLSKQEKGSFTKKFTIKQGICYVWDSFSNAELMSSIQPSGECVFKYKLPDQTEKSKIEEIEWKNVRLSSALRYYRASQPLLFALFGSNPVSNSVTRVFFPPAISSEDMIYIAENHPISDELQSAIAGAILLSLSQDEILSFIEKYDIKFPNLLYHIMRYVPCECKFAEKLLPSIERHYQFYPDDLEVAAKYLRIKPTISIPFVLFNSLWCTPMAGIAIARKFIHDKRYNDAFLMLNVAAYARGWPSLNVNLRNIECEKPKKASERGPSLSDVKFISAPVVGANTEYFSTIAELQEKMGNIAFLTLVRTFAATHKTGRCTNDQRLWPYDKHVYVDTVGCLLFDPGEVLIGDSVSVYDQFAFSQSFQDVISDVQKADERRKKILSGFGEVGDLTAVLLLGIRLRDEHLLMFAFDKMKSQRMSTATDQMLFMKASIMGIGPAMNDIISMDVVPSSICQQNAFGFVKCLVLCMDQLCK